MCHRRPCRVESRDLLQTHHSESELPITVSYSQKQHWSIQWICIGKMCEKMLFLIPSIYMHIWLGGVQAIFQKATFLSYHLMKISFQYYTKDTLLDNKLE